jgi:hypothetical protein
MECGGGLLLCHSKINVQGSRGKRSDYGGFGLLVNCSKVKVQGSRGSGAMDCGGGLLVSCSKIKYRRRLFSVMGCVACLMVNLSR